MIQFAASNKKQGQGHRLAGEEEHGQARHMTTAEPRDRRDPAAAEKMRGGPPQDRGKAEGQQCAKEQYLEAHKLPWTQIPP